MKNIVGIASLVAILCLFGISKGQGQVYFFSTEHFSNSFNQELGLSFFTHYTRSPHKETVYEFDATAAYPQPVFVRAYSLFSISYEPQFRLMEIGSNHSFSLNVPLTLSASFVDMRTADDSRYKAEQPTAQERQDGINYLTRSTYLGLGHLETAFLLSYNLGRNATSENTWLTGYNIAAGYNLIYGPLYMHSEAGDRSEYSSYLRWGHLVGRFGFQFSRVGFNYMVGLNQTTVQYFEPGERFSSSIEVSIYHRATFTIRLGK